jgi:hypothetical protein
MPLDDPEALTSPVTGAGVRVAPDADNVLVRDVALPDLVELQRAADGAGARFWVSAGYREPAEDDPSVSRDPTLPSSCPVELPPRAPAPAMEGAPGVAPDVPATGSSSTGPSQQWLGTVVSVRDRPVGPATMGVSTGSTADWLTRHSWEYGFIPALPEPDGSPQGDSEPLRLRWVGRAMAQELRDAIGRPDYVARVEAAFRRAQAELGQREP